MTDLLQSGNLVSAPVVEPGQSSASMRSLSPECAKYPVFKASQRSTRSGQFCLNEFVCIKISAGAPYTAAGDNGRLHLPLPCPSVHWDCGAANKTSFASYISQCTDGQVMVDANGRFVTSGGMEFLLNLMQMSSTAMT